MHVVGHQDVGMDRAAVLLSAFAQTVEVEEVIFLGEEGRLSIIAALDGVLGTSTKCKRDLRGMGGAVCFPL
jgi:hypothetical protein